MTDARKGGTELFFCNCGDVADMVQSSTQGAFWSCPNRGSKKCKFFAKGKLGPTDHQGPKCHRLSNGEISLIRLEGCVASSASNTALLPAVRAPSESAAPNGAAPDATGAINDGSTVDARQSFTVTLYGDMFNPRFDVLGVLRFPQFQGTIVPVPTATEEQGANNARGKKLLFPLEVYDALVQRLKALPDVYPSRIEQVPTFVLRVIRKMEEERRVTQDNLQSNLIKPFDHSDPLFANKLRPFQMTGVDFVIARNGRAMIGDEMGLGKTVQAVAVAHHYRAEWPVLVICLASLAPNWASHFERWLMIPRERIKLVVGGSNKKSKSRNNLLQDDSAVGIFIVGLQMLAKFKAAHPSTEFKVVIIDESHKIKTNEADCSQHALELCKKATRVLLLSGTPIMNRPEEAYTQLLAIRPDLLGNCHTAYKARFCNGHMISRYGNPHQRIPNSNGHSHTPELNLLLRNFVIRRMKDDVLNMSTKDRQVYKIRMLEQEKKQLEDDLKRFRRQSNNFSGGQSTVAFHQKTSIAKTAAVVNYVEEALDKIQASNMLLANGGDGDGNNDANLQSQRREQQPPEKIIFFAHHKELLQAMKDAAERKCIDHIFIDGSVSNAKREEQIAHFKNECTCVAAFLSIHAAGTGHDFTAASTVVFAELMWTPSLHRQCEDRVHRIGQLADVCHIRYLYAEGTSDEVMWPMLEEKLKVTTGVMDENLAGDAAMAPVAAQPAGATATAAAATTRLVDNAVQDATAVVRTDAPPPPTPGPANNGTARGGRSVSNDKRDANQPSLDKWFVPPGGEKGGAQATVAAAEDEDDDDVVCLGASNQTNNETAAVDGSPRHRQEEGPQVTTLSAPPQLPPPTSNTGGEARGGGEGGAVLNFTTPARSSNVLATVVATADAPPIAGSSTTIATTGGARNSAPVRPPPPQKTMFNFSKKRPREEAVAEAEAEGANEPLAQPGGPVAAPVLPVAAPVAVVETPLVAQQGAPPPVKPELKQEQQQPQLQCKKTPFQLKRSSSEGQQQQPQPASVVVEKISIRSKPSVVVPSAPASSASNVQPQPAPAALGRSAPPPQLASAEAATAVATTSTYYQNRAQPPMGDTAASLGVLVAGAGAASTAGAGTTSATKPTATTATVGAEIHRGIQRNNNTTPTRTSASTAAVAPNVLLNNRAVCAVVGMPRSSRKSQQRQPHGGSRSSVSQVSGGTGSRTSSGELRPPPQLPAPVPVLVRASGGDAVQRTPLVFVHQAAVGQEDAATHGPCAAAHRQRQKQQQQQLPSETSMRKRARDDSAQGSDEELEII